MGLFLLTVTQSFVSGSWIPEAFAEEEEEVDDQQDVATDNPDEITVKIGAVRCMGETMPWTFRFKALFATIGQVSSTKWRMLAILWPRLPTRPAIVVSLTIRPFLSQVVHNTGCWTIFDAYLFPGSLACNIVYLVRSSTRSCACDDDTCGHGASAAPANNAPAGSVLASNAADAGGRRYHLCLVRFASHEFW